MNERLSPREGLDNVFREIAEFTYDLESWIGTDGRTRWINPAVQRITGYTVDECLARDDYPYFFTHPDDRARVGDALEHARKHISGNDLEFRIVHKDGHVRWGAISWQDLLDSNGECRGYRTSVRDITARKAAENDLLQSRDEAYRASRAKSEFLATMSHEIRTPIQNILGYAQLLQRTTLDDAQKKYLDVLADQGEVLLRIVDDILDFTSLQSTAIRLEHLPFVLQDCVLSVTESIRHTVLSKNLQLNVGFTQSEPLRLVGDVHRLRQVLSNLLNNAVKFTDRGAVTVHVTSEATTDADPMVPIRIDVCDTGIGMNPSEIAQLFQPFTQTDASISRRFGGSGLGLHICKRLVELLNGSLEVQSQPGEGSTFSVKLRMEKDARPAIEPHLTPPVKSVAVESNSFPCLDVLVVDDTEIARQVSVELLYAAGQAAHAVSNGADAIRALQAFPFDLVLMDKRMPVMDGLQLTRVIRRLNLSHQPFVAAVTANVLPAARQACLDAGMDTFLGKPVRIADLRNIVIEAAARKNPTNIAATSSSRSWFDDTVLQSLLAKGISGTSPMQRQKHLILRELANIEETLRGQLTLSPMRNITELAHAVRGSLLTIGARCAADAAHAVEAQFATADDSTRFQQILALCQAIGRTRIEVDRIVR